MMFILLQLDLQSVVEEANDKHLSPWAGLCSSSGINNTPLSPYATVENLSGHKLWIDNSKLVNDTGFQFIFPKPSMELLKEVCLLNLV